jgi:hypothetical protein
MDVWYLPGRFRPFHLFPAQRFGDDYFPACQAHSGLTLILDSFNIAFFGFSWNKKKASRLMLSLGGLLFLLEAATGFEPVNNGFADRCLSHLAMPPAELK